MQFYRDGGVQVDPPPKVNVDFTHRDVLDPFVPTGNYNPQTRTITVFAKNRQLKDVLRSFCHELVHHNQMLSDPEGFMSVNKAGTLQENDALTALESDAYMRGNVLFRKWTEARKPKSV